MISIIVPVYNSGKTLGECIDSLLNQDYRGEYEIVLVDDNSIDNPIWIIDEFTKKTNKIILLKQEHMGPAAARNLGANNAKGDILLFTDSDCVTDKNWIDEMIKPFESDEIIGVQGRYKTKQSEIVAKFAQYEIEERYEKMGKSRYIDFIGSYSAAYKKEVFLGEGGFDENYQIASGEDPDLSFRLSSKGYKMVFNPNAIVYHDHPNSLFKYLNMKFYRAYWRIPLYRKNRGKVIKDTYTPQILKFQVGLVYLVLLSTIFTFFNGSVYLLIAMLLLLVISSLPLSFHILIKDIKVGLISPFIVILRSGVFALGLIYGISKEFRSFIKV